MKRLLCAVLVLILLPVLAVASDFDDFNTFASVLGANELDPEKSRSSDVYTQYEQDGCSVGFETENGSIKSVFIDGDGVSFLAYCCAAIHIFDPDGSATSNHGQFLTSYLLSKNADEYSAGQTTNGKYFFVTYENGQYSFMLVK